MYSDITNQLRTTSDKRDFLEEMETLKKSLYEGDGAFDKSLQEKVRSSTLNLLEKSLPEKRNKIEEFLEALAKEAENLKEIELVLAIELTEESINDIHNWISQNISKGLIMDIKIDKTIVGGAKIIKDGKYFNFSLDAMISTYLKNNVFKSVQ